MNRRAFLLALSAGTVAATAGAAATAGSASAGVRPRAASPTPHPAPGYRHRPGNPNVHDALPMPGRPGLRDNHSSDAIIVADETQPAASVQRIEPASAPPREGAIAVAPVPRLINALPGADPTVAITVDDGTDSAVIKAYLDFAEASGVRLTFFLNGINPGWTDHRDQLRRLVDSGQVQLGNHTWSHPDITGLSDGALADQIRRNEKFLNDTYGVTGRPFFRPPFGYHNARTDRVCADLGYTAITMWYGTFGDSSVLSEGELLSLAQQWLTAHRVVIGHANHPTVTHLYPQLLDLIRSRGLTTVTLDDAFYGPDGRDRTNFG